MQDKIVVGPLNRGLRTDREPFVIDNESFPRIFNAYQWRGRVKRKRGTELLGRLTRFFNSTISSYSSTTTIALVAGAANILTGFSLQSSGNIVPGTVIITDITAGNTYTDPAMDGTLVGAPGGTGTINYATGGITITGGGADLINATFLYTPDLPVMGLEEFITPTSAFAKTLAFDTVYSYLIDSNFPYAIHDVSFYKNPSVSVTLPGYIPKTAWTPVTWNGEDYQQFWSVNYQGAIWVTNGIQVPFNPSNIGMQFKPIITVTVTAGGPPAIATLQITGHGLVVGDFIFINEVLTTTGINWQTGYVIAVLGPNTVSVEFPNATIAGNGTGGIAQYLTNRSDVTKDTIRWFDGDPTNGSATAPTFSQGKGWVNFSPPLSRNPFSIAQAPPKIYYLVGARMIVPYKDRLLFVGPVIQSSAGDDQIYLQDTVIYSQNGTPYYTSSFTGDVSLSSTVFFPILVPVNQTATANAYFEDQTGFGGFVSAGIDIPAVTVEKNEDVLIIGFDATTQTKLIYTGNDLVPFNFFLINSEYGSSSTFSSINMDAGVVTIGRRGIIMTSQDQAKRIDQEILDQIFQINLLNNGTERVCAQRDFINEWVYFTYVSNEESALLSPDKIFPNQTIFFNYRDNSWALFNECYTHYGQFIKSSGFTWATVGAVYPTWSEWNDPWDAGASTIFQPDLIAGNQQGFILVRDDGTGEGNSLYIESFSGSVITSPNHGLNNGDYIVISGAIGTIGTQVNGNIFSVSNPTQNTFTLNPTITAGTYFGGGLIKRMYVPFVQTKQFPTAWGMGRKTRIGVQRYLLSKTDNAQITLLIYLSQNASDPYNDGPIFPTVNAVNDSLIYSTVLYTCPESTNIGLTPITSNLMTPTANQQQQIWHRKNTSLIGDTVQLGFTMSDLQMRTVDDEGNFISQFAEIELHGFIIEVSPSQMLV